MDRRWWSKRREQLAQAAQLLARASPERKAREAALREAARGVKRPRPSRAELLASLQVDPA